MSYTIEYSHNAAQRLRELPRDVQKLLKPHVEALRSNPRPHGVKKLKAFDNLYRLRVSVYQVLHRVDDDRLVILRVEIAHRHEAC